MPKAGTYKLVLWTDNKAVKDKTVKFGAVLELSLDADSYGAGATVKKLK